MVHVQFVDSTYAFSIEFTTYSPNLVRIGQLTNKRQQLFFKYWMVTATILSVSHCTFSDMTDAFYVTVAQIPLNLVRIGWIVMNWQQFFGIQDAAILIFGNYAFFRLNRCILHRGFNMFTKFGEGWSISKEMATVFRNSIWRQLPYWILISVLLFDITYASCIGIATFPPNLVRIGRIVLNWQHLSVIQDGGNRHTEF